jgi:hypothetical protein
MIKFSELNNLGTTKDTIIENFTKSSGLPISTVTKLYESYCVSFGGYQELIQQQFDKLLESDNDIFEDVIEAIKNVFEENINNKSEKISHIIDKSKLDSSNFIKLIYWVVGLLGDFNNNLSMIELFESSDLLNINDLNSNLLKIDATYFGELKKIPIQEKITFFNNLGTILAKNNKRWGINYHLDNAYNTIQQFIAQQAEELANQNNVYQVSNEFTEQLFKSLYMGNLPPMYRDVNYLKQMVPDLQTLIFDLLIFVSTTISRNRQYTEYFNYDSYNEFRRASNDLYKALISSKDKSFLLKKHDHINEPTVPIQEPKESRLESNFFDTYVDFEKFDTYYTTLKVSNLVDAVYIIKSCAFEFNLSIRPLLRNYVTKAFNILGKLEQLILEDKKINKYK